MVKINVRERVCWDVGQLGLDTRLVMAAMNLELSINNGISLNICGLIYPIL
jgi:hypothetical protein